MTNFKMIDKKSIMKNSDNKGKNNGGSSLIIQSNPLDSEARKNAIKKTKRKKLILGRKVHTLPNGSWKLGEIVYHIPSPFPSQTEAIYFKGPPGSGKSWAAYSLAGQSFFAENRTWIIIDTKLSYLGNNRPNYKFMDQIKSMGGFPRGISHSQIDVIAPMYYVNGLVPQELKDSLVTDFYKIPLRLCTLPVMFEITKLNKKAGYASSFDQKFKDLLIRTHNNPKISDVNEMIENIIDDPEMSRMKWVYQMMRKKIEEVAELTIDDESKWSSIGKYLEKAANEGRARWIVFTLGHAQNPEDDLNLAIISTVLKEIHLFSEKVRHNPDKYPNFAIGVMMDELHTYVRNKDASTRSAIHDLLFAWGRTSRVLRMFLSLPPEEKIWCIDSNNKLKLLQIGDLVDNVILKYPKKVHRYNDKFYEAIEENVEGWKVLSRNPDTLQIEIKKITAFIRHDNIDEIYIITLENGKKVKVTGCHSLYTQDPISKRPIKIEVRNLNIGDLIEIALYDSEKRMGHNGFEKIQNIKKTIRNTKVYDISVNRFENFISEDFIVCSNTQKDEQLDKVFQDDIKKDVSPVGTYQCVISCSAIPEPGYITYVNRVQPNPSDPDRPLYYPKVKSCPPLFDVESDEPDDEKWKDKVISNWRNDLKNN